MSFRKMSLLSVLITLGPSSVALAKEYPIGAHINQGGMEIGVVYLQPIEMDPPDMMKATLKSDIHLEADIHAIDKNINGFAKGDWIPYLRVTYKLTKIDNGAVVSGDMMPMVANDGPHYGDNVKLAGIGKYRIEMVVSPPSGHDFGRHIDKETGVGSWFKPITFTNEFTYAGIGKKGAY